MREYFSSYINAITSSMLRTSVLKLSSFLRASVLPSAASTLPSVEAATFVRFLTFLYWVLSHPYLFTLRCQLVFIFLCQLYLFINRCCFSYYLPFLLPDQACGRNVVNSTVCCFSVCCPLNYLTSLILFILHNCRNFLSASHFGPSLVFSARFGAAFCCFNFAFC